MVIVVDDDDAIRASMRFLLECEGIEVEDFASGPQLIAANWPPRAGCLILDLHMPEMSGLELLDRLRATSSSMPVIVVTGQANIGSRERALSAGALAVLEKPLNDGKLLDLVRQALNQSHQPAAG